VLDLLSSAPPRKNMTGDSPSATQLNGIADLFVRELAALGRLRSYPKNTVFITEGDSSDSVFVILSGRVKIFLSDTEGHEMILDTQGPGEYVGEMALDGNPRSASVMARSSRTNSRPRGCGSPSPSWVTSATCARWASSSSGAAIPANSARC